MNPGDQPAIWASVVRMNMHLHDPVPTDLYHYFTASEAL